MKNIRQPAHAWTFYPANPHLLLEMLMWFYSEIDKYINFSLFENLADNRYVFVPHAWYIYSWIIATAWYKVFQMNNLETVDTLIIIWPAHYDAIDWWMLADFDWFATPFGIVEIDKKLQNLILEKLPNYFSIYNPAHIPEHSLEVQLPFIQTFLKVKKIVPILAWIQPNIDIVAKFFSNLFKENRNIWLIISTDLSHYLSYEDAIKVDNLTLEKFLKGQSNIWPYEACGYSWLNLLIEISKNLNYKRDVIIYANSGDTSWMKDKVVGYASWLVYI